VTTCIYALTSPAPRRLRATGFAGEPLRVVTVATISAVIGEVRHAPTPTTGAVRRYGDTLQAIFAQTSALLPARFGTCVADLDELEFILRSRRVSLRAALRHVRHRAQMTVRVVRPGSSAAAPPAAPSPPVPPSASSPASSAARRSGTAYLRGRAADAARARDIAGFEPVRAATARWVRDERVEQQPRLATVYHLVPRGSVDAYRSALERAGSGAGLHLVISGPWPPFAFAAW
jgi:hypothetical protein